MDTELWDGRSPEEACKSFLQEQGTTTHIMQQGFGTMILTTLGREDLADYLFRLAAKIAEDPNRRDDLLHVEVEELPTGDKKMAAILSVEVS